MRVVGSNMGGSAAEGKQRFIEDLFLIVCYSKDEFSWEKKIFSKLQAGRQKEKWHQVHQKERGGTVLLLMEEILHQLIGSLSHYFQSFIHPRWLFGIFWTIVTVGSPFFLPGPMVLRDLDLSIHGGETILLLGDYGSGKSSLILAFLGVSRWFDGVGDLRSLKRSKRFASSRDVHSAFFLQSTISFYQNSIKPNWFFQKRSFCRTKRIVYIIKHHASGRTARSISRNLGRQVIWSEGEEEQLGSQAF